MKLLISSILFLNQYTVKAATSPSFTTTTKNDNESLTFQAWQTLHKKSYTSATELSQRQLIYKSNSNIVQTHNAAYKAGLTTWKMSMESPFADMTAQEFEDLYLMDAQECSATTHSSSGLLRPSSSFDKKNNENDSQNKQVMESKNVDWRTKGIMTPVKNQGGCGSCWTFSTTGCLEAHTCLAKKGLYGDGIDCTHWTGLAEQQLVDCAGSFNNFGCNGGLPSQAYEYIKYSGGLDLEDTYTYTAQDGTCKANDGKVGATVTGVYNITSRDEDDLMYAIETMGPVSIAYQVSPDFRLYQHGVYDSYNATSETTMCHSENTDVNHAVVAVGLGTTQDNVDYYIVRNSWGTLWGMEGHFWMKRGENLCGVSDCASFPLVPASKDGTKMDGAVEKSLLRGSEMMERVAAVA